jgi:hypothetical protein
MEVIQRWDIPLGAMNLNTKWGKTLHRGTLNEASILLVSSKSDTSYSSIMDYCLTSGFSQTFMITCILVKCFRINYITGLFFEGKKSETKI